MEQLRESEMREGETDDSLHLDRVTRSQGAVNVVSRIHADQLGSAPFFQMPA